MGKGTTCEVESCSRGYCTFERSSLLAIRLHTSASQAGNGSNLLSKQAYIFNHTPTAVCGYQASTRGVGLRDSLLTDSVRQQRLPNIIPNCCLARADGALNVTKATRCDLKSHSTGKITSVM
jgi:hypothetical protein